MTVPTVHLRPRHVQPVWMGHPWVFAQAIARLEGSAGPGDEVAVRDPEGHFLGRGFYSPTSAIPVRVLTRDDVPLDDAFLRARLADALGWRRAVLDLPSAETTGYRAVNSEGDALPGLIVDVFGDALVAQFLTIGMKRRQGAIVAALASLTGAGAVFEAASARHQKLEGFEAQGGLVHGEKRDALAFRELGVEHAITPPGTPGGGQKTGYYFDQRENRALVASLARGRRVLDLFSYVGGFALNAARGGAREVLAVDSSAPALEVLARAARALGAEDRVRAERGDVRAVLGAMENSERYDLVVLDPPKLAPRGRDADEARGHYRKLNAAAVRRVAPGGLLVTCSCSGSVSEADFVRAVAAGARDVGRDLVVLKVTGQAPDHPAPVAFPEGRYLKCVVARVR